MVSAGIASDDDWVESETRPEEMMAVSSTEFVS